MRRIPQHWIVGSIFFICRLIFIISTPLDGIKSYGDFTHFYHLAQMGVPFVDIWVEFPPIFPFLSWLVYQLAGGREHVYDYSLLIIISLFQVGCIIAFSNLVKKTDNKTNHWISIAAFFLINLILPYTWWYFDVIAVMLMLLGVNWLLEGKDIRAIVILAIGALIKLFPALAICIIWRYRPVKKAIFLTLLLGALVVGVYGILYCISPDFTKASVVSQSSKGSWETVWALIDGNLHTGNFGAEIERYDPEMAVIPQGNTPRISPWITLWLFLAVGFYIFTQLSDKQPIIQVSLVCMSILVFFLWMQGWSPQWILFIIPFILIIFDDKEGIIISCILVLINLLEWPVLLSRGFAWGLWLTVPIRTLFLICLILLIFYRIKKGELSMTKKESQEILEHS